MKISEQINKNNLHHAYLIEGTRDEVVPELIAFIQNEEVVQINLDSFKIDDARNLKSYGAEKGYSDKKKVFIISANSFLLEAQNTLLKMFEEPIEDTHFFLIVPDVSALLKTFISRFYLIRTKEGTPLREAEEFIKMPLQRRIDFIKELLTEADEDEENPALDSTRSKALKFLNAIESCLHKTLQNFSSVTCYHHIFKVREFLRMPGSSTKSLMESVAIMIPVL
ncbi:MAG: hypothetical protein V4486_01680 [Patescibacteria group bacterium]